MNARQMKKMGIFRTAKCYPCYYHFGRFFFWLFAHVCQTGINILRSNIYGYSFSRFIKYFHIKKTLLGCFHFSNSACEKLICSGIISCADEFIDKIYIHDRMLKLMGENMQEFLSFLLSLLRLFSFNRLRKRRFSFFFSCIYIHMFSTVCMHYIDFFSLYIYIVLRKMR